MIYTVIIRRNINGIVLIGYSLLVFTAFKKNSELVVDEPAKLITRAELVAALTIETILVAVLY
jgi:hypothetical protein